MAKKKKQHSVNDWIRENYGITTDYAEEVRAMKAAKAEEEDIAPVKETKEEERTWFSSGAFDDGYQFGDVFKTITGTGLDLMENIYSGAAGIVEKTIDAGAYVAGGVGGLIGADDFKKKTQEFIAKDIINEDKVGETLATINGGFVAKAILGETTTDEVSLFGEKTDSLIQSGGQLAATIGLQAVGVPWWVTSGATSFGGATEEAFKEGASYGEAGVYGAISAGAEILTEKLFGGSGLGEKGLVNLDYLTKGISSKAVKALADLGIDMAAEGSEEVLSSVMTRLGSALYKEENIGELLGSEEAFDEYLESFIGGAALGGVMNASNAVQSAKQKTDYRTGLTTNEEKVFDAEYKNRIAAEEQDGKKLSKNEKAKIYDEVMEDLQKGGISIDTIEEVLGGDSYKTYKDTFDSETKQETELKAEIESLENLPDNQISVKQRERLNEARTELANLYGNSQKDTLKSKLSEDVFNLTKQDGLTLKQRGSFLTESYNEEVRKTQKYEADVSKYDEKQSKIVQKAIDSGVLNNTRRSHELVDMIAKISADKNIDFDFANNEKIKNSSYGVDGKTINGYVENGTITLNTQSTKYLKSVAGHEITHILEGTELYDSLQKTIFEYAKTKGEYQNRYDTLSELYKGVKGYEGDAETFSKKIDKELTADLVGDYLFTDNDFIRKLSTENRNAFQKIYDEIKYLCKVATAGSKEARQLEKVRKAFEDVYRESGEAQKNTAENSGVDYSISRTKSMSWSDQVNGVLYDGKNIRRNDTLVIGNPSENLTKDGVSNKPLAVPVRVVTKATSGKDISHSIKRGKIAKLDEGIKNAPIVTVNPDRNAVVYITNVKQGGLPIVATFDMDAVFDGDEVHQATSIHLQTDTMSLLQSLPQNATIYVQKKGELNAVGVTNNLRSLAATIKFTEESVTQNEPSVNTQFSLSDSDGKELSKGQQEYFKDSKVRDENGNLKVMYHGSQDAGFHTFESRFSDDDTSFFFVDRNEAAASYSGTYETYEAKAFKTAEDANKFFAEIGKTEYEVVEKDGKYTLLDDGDEVATSDNLSEIYDEWRDWEGVGYGDANYKVYLNLKNPLVVDADGRNWNNVSREFSQDIYNRYKTLTGDEMSVLSSLASWEDIGIFRDELRQALADTETGKPGTYDEAFAKNVRNAYEKLGGNSVNMYDLFTIASDNFSEESLKQFAVKQMNTRDYAQRAKEQGYDGVIFNNIVDLGGYSNGSEGAATVAVAFDSNQIKSVANTEPTSDPDIRYSLSVDSEGRELSSSVQNRFAKSQVVDENGRLKAVYHGTASGEFSIFDKAKGSVEGDFGSGFYFTDNEFDVEEHYEGGGPDFENKVGRRADEIWNENPDLSYEEAEERAYKELYKGSHKFEVYLNIENPAIVGETNLLESDKYFSEYNQEDYDNEDDYYADVEQLVADDIDNIIWEIERNVDVNNTGGIAEILWNAFNEGGVGIEDLKKQLNNLYLEDSEGNLVANEVARQIIESLGYDGIIDPTVSAKWNMDMEAGTTHYIVFKPNQIKDVGNQNPTDNPDINLSLSEEGAAPYKYGDSSFKGNNVAYEGRTEAVEDIAPVKEDSQTPNPVADIAPMQIYEEPVSEPTVYELEREKEAVEGKFTEAFGANDSDSFENLMNEYRSLEERIQKAEAEESAWNSERLASLGDVDAPIEQEAQYSNLPDTTPLTKKAASDIVKPMKEMFGLSSKQAAEVRTAIENYSKSEAPSREELTETVREAIGNTFEEEVPGVKEVQNSLRNTKIKVSDAIKKDIADYNQVRKSHFRKIGFNNSGIDVDSAYQELSSLYPEFFPEDIANPSDQFMRMVEVSDMARTIETEYEVDNEYIDGIVDNIIGEINAYKQTELQKLAEKEAKHIPQFAPGEDIAPVKETAQKATAKELYETIRPKRSTQPKVVEVAPTEPKMVRVDSNNGRPGEKQRKWVKTSTNSEAVDGKILPEDLNQNTIHYQPISNKTTLGNANSRIESDGYESSVEHFNHRFKTKSISLDDVALGERLIQEAIKRGDTKTAGELIQNVAILGTELGQKVQALSIIKRLTPQGQLGMLEKLVMRGKTKGDKAYEGVELTQDMKDKILKVYNEDGSYDQNKLNDAVEDVKQQIADKMKVSKMDKVNAWRYLSMLGNPKTHIRNLVSNIAMKGTVAVKNVIARTIEDIAPIKNRTKTWESATEAVKAFSEKTTAEMKDVLSDGGKYSEDASIKAKRAIFKNKVLNGLYEFNSDLLSKEDWWFSKPAFNNALSEFLAANGIRTEQDIANNPEIVEKAKQYATEQSQIATFRQYSWLANKINEGERHNTGANIAIGAILPFKKTPINIAKTGLNYSPLGFMKTLTYDVSKVKNGTMEASELVDHLSQNITGTALTLVGYMLASAGFLGGAGDDDKEGKYDYQLGEQSYSVNIGGKSYSLSWLSPVAMPLFVGANAYEQLVEGKEWNGDVVVETLAQTLDPLSEMSFLSGLNQVLSSYEGGIGYFAGIGETMAQNYATQFIPTFSSQVATVMDDTKRSTKVAGDSDFRFVDETINKLKLKIPGLRETLEPSTDIWGNEVKQSENLLTRAFETFIAPYSTKDNISSEIDAEIKSLYSAVGDNSLIPSIPDNYVNYKDEKHKMSAKEFTDFKQAYGQTAYNMLEDLFATETYKNASAEDKADWVSDVYDYARDEAKRVFLAGKGVEYTNATEEGVEYYKENAIKGAIENDVTPDEYSFSYEYPEKYEFFKENGITYEDYKAADEDGKRAYSWAAENPGKYVVSKAVTDDVIQYRKYTSDLYDIRADYDSSGKAISGSSKAKKTEYINNLPLDYGQRIILYRSLFDAQKDKDAYNADIVEYLNSRNDISYEDMVTILEELGMTVYSDGRVTW